MQTETPDFLALIEALVSHDVQFVIVGALSAVLQGAPVMTFDLVVVYLRSEGNVDRLLDVLASLDASYRGHPNKALSPGREHLLGPGHQLLSTRFGPLDLLGVIEDGLTYADLEPGAVQMQVDELKFLVLPLKHYVELKARSHLEKDRARLPVLRETLKLKDNTDK